MPAAVAKGIILSISILTALSLAVLENDQIKAWLEEQRQKIAELLRSLGEELDPQSRRQAEAFAFEGRTPANDEAIARERSASQEAVAVATGRSLSNASTIRRIPVQGRMDPDEAEERRRKGREYLAKRNQQMYELQQRRKETSGEGSQTPTSPTSFDAMVDEEGKLRLNGKERELPSPPALDLPEAVKSEMREVERHLSQPLLVGESSASSSGWSFGSAFANPFSDEHALDRSETPKPPVPPKVALDPQEPLTMPGSFETEPQPQQTEAEQEELSYEEQLAIALSLSEQEAQQSANAEMSRRIAAEDENDPDLRAAIAAAIEASLKEVQSTPTAASLPEQAPSQPRAPELLVDLSPHTPTLPAHQSAPRGHWETLFDQDYSPVREPLSLAQSDADSDELYSVTPDLPRARLVSPPVPALSSLPTIPSLPTISSPPATHSMPYDPVREAAGQPQRRQPSAMEASFYSAVSSAPSPASSHTMSHEATPQLIDVSEDVPFAETRTPMSPSSFGFETDESDSDTFASMSASRTRSRSHSRPRSEISNVEVLDLVEDSDVDMLSNEGDGIVTPDSWTEVGSRDGESEMEDEEPRRVNLI